MKVLRLKTIQDHCVCISTGGSVDVPEDLLTQLKDLQDQLKALGKAREKVSPTTPT